MTPLEALRSRLAAATGPRCGRAYRYEFHDEGELIVSDGACDYPAGHTGDCGPMQPGEGAPTWEDVALALGSGADLALSPDGCAVLVGGVAVDEAWRDRVTRLLARAVDNRWQRDRQRKIDAALADYAARGYTHIKPLGNRWSARDPGGLPVVLTWCGGLCVAPAERRDEVGEGPAVEGRVPGGRRWYALGELGSRWVGEWRLAAPDARGRT